MNFPSVPRFACAADLRWVGMAGCYEWYCIGKRGLRLWTRTRFGSAASDLLHTVHMNAKKGCERSVTVAMCAVRASLKGPLTRLCVFGILHDVSTACVHVLRCHTPRQARR